MQFSSGYFCRCTSVESFVISFRVELRDVFTIRDIVFSACFASRHIFRITTHPPTRQKPRNCGFRYSLAFLNTACSMTNSIKLMIAFSVSSHNAFPCFTIFTISTMTKFRYDSGLKICIYKIKFE